MRRWRVSATPPLRRVAADRRAVRQRREGLFSRCFSAFHISVRSQSRSQSIICRSPTLIVTLGVPKSRFILPVHPTRCLAGSPDRVSNRGARPTRSPIVVAISRKRQNLLPCDIDRLAVLQRCGNSYRSSRIACVDRVETKAVVALQDDGLLIDHPVDQSRHQHASWLGRGRKRKTSAGRPRSFAPRTIGPEARQQRLLTK